MKKVIPLAILLVTAITAQAEEVREVPMADKHKPTQAFEAQVFESEDAIFFSIPEKKLQYYVTKPNHPAYPYIVENIVLGRGVDTRFKANGYGDADNEAVKKWLEEIDQINKGRMADLKKTEGEVKSE